MADFTKCINKTYRRAERCFARNREVSGRIQIKANSGRVNAANKFNSAEPSKRDKYIEIYDDDDDDDDDDDEYDDDDDRRFHTHSSTGV